VVSVRDLTRDVLMEYLQDNECSLSVCLFAIVIAIVF
jgi:hypothetical protein